MIAYLFQPFKNGEKSRLWSARIRLDGWPKLKYFPLHVTDRRVADQKMRELVTELERDAHGVGVPKATREAQQTPLLEHHAAFLAACESAKLSPNTLNKYRHSLPKLFERCGWKSLRDVSASSFVTWRERSGLLPKTVNDLLGSMRTMLLWMQRTRLILIDPLSEVRKVHNDRLGSFRRSLSVEELQRLLTKSPRRRAVIYQTIVYTGLRRAEMNGLKWDDFKLADSQPYVRVPSSISKNRKESIHYLRPELVASLRTLRPAGAKPEDFVFRGQMPRIPTFKRDLAAAEIPFADVRGRRIDLHGLRKTYGTMLAAAGVSPRVAMELMRHSDMKLTMGVYTDVAQLPMIAETARLPSLSLPNTPIARTTPPGERKLDAQGDAQRYAQPRVAAGPSVTHAVAAGQNSQLRIPLENVALGHEKAPQDNLRRFSEMERAKRLELSTSTLARWCSTN
jgi:integrase